MACNPRDYPVGVDRCAASPVYICNTEDINGNSMPLPSVVEGTLLALAPVCAAVDGVPVKITPIVFVTTTGIGGAPQYLDPLGLPVTGTSIVVINDCHCEPPADDCPVTTEVDLLCYDTGNGSVAVTGTQTTLYGGGVTYSLTVVETTDPAYPVGALVTDIASFTALECLCDDLESLTGQC